MADLQKELLELNQRVELKLAFDAGWNARGMHELGVPISKDEAWLRYQRFATKGQVGDS